MGTLTTYLRMSKWMWWPGSQLDRIEANLEANQS